ncbi:MAG: Rrf2 family transcriptional regulator [Candidatus Krumholzibacteriota bacterium]|nr:Rrf2 family transcriptional regulator [Candidatus Krumholzibacteriota bacterium]
MEFILRKTDYAMRALLKLSRNIQGGPISTSVIAEEEDISYPLACKLMQSLQQARIVKSCMGPAGGFELVRDPAKISLLDIIETIQGPVVLGKCQSRENGCERKPDCPVTVKLGELKDHMENYLAGVTFADLVSWERPGRE